MPSKLKSFLSPYVQNIFVGSYEKCEAEHLGLNNASQSVFFETLQENVSKKYKELPKNNLESPEDYVVASKNLCSIFYDTLSLEFSSKEIKFYSELIAQWLDSIEAEVVREWFFLTEDNMEAKCHLFLLQITSSLEHGLGNVSF